jgi:ribulose bisphosphate carboxylase small subunit
VRLTQGCFSFLPDLTDEQIEKQITYAISRGWAMNVEWTDDPHPRNSYWELWGLPLFDVIPSVKRSNEAVQNTKTPNFLVTVVWREH